MNNLGSQFEKVFSVDFIMPVLKGLQSYYVTCKSTPNRHFNVLYKCFCMIVVKVWGNFQVRQSDLHIEIYFLLIIIKLIIRIKNTNYFIMMKILT